MTMNAMKNNFGIQIANPMALGLTEYVNCEYKQTWAEKRSKELIWKLKRRRSTLNKFIVTILMILSAVLILGFLLCLIIIVRSELIGIILGILGGQLMILSYYFWTDKFELNANCISAKHKDKIYY